MKRKVNNQIVFGLLQDFRNKLYPAGTLRDKTWLEMKSRLEIKGVKVRNECIPEG